MKRMLAVLLITVFVLSGCGETEGVTGYGAPQVNWAPIVGYTEEQSDAIKQELAERIVYNPPSGDIGALELWLDEIGKGQYLGTLIFNKEFWQKGYEFVGIDTERHIEALEMDGNRWLGVTVRALFKQGENTFTYNDSALELMIPVTVEENGEVKLGEYFAKEYYASSADPQEDWRSLNYNRNVINLHMADVTHDGTEDYIATVIWNFPGSTAKTPEEMLRSGEVGYVEVYDGNKEKNPQSPTIKPIWEKDFAQSRPGNKQISIVQRDGKEYLLISNINAQQGSYSFRYEVFSLDDMGREYIVERETLSFDNHTEVDQRLSEEQKQQVQIFKEHISAWFDEGYLVVATDVDNMEQFMSTPEQAYRMEDYYNIVWLEYLD